MKTHLIPSTLLFASALVLGPFLAQADETPTEIGFSNPSKPGTLKIRVWHGDVSVHGQDVKDVSVRSELTPSTPTPRKDGLRVLSASAGYALSEKDNVVTLDYGPGGWTGGSADFEITVPRSTSIVVANSAHGEFECSGISGDIDVRTVSGDVNLENISGGALVETVNGEINVKVKSLPASRPLSFTSMRGQIAIHLPADSKADVRFRTHRGVILTDFDDKSLVTKSEISPGMPGKLGPVAAAPATPALPVAPVSAAEPASPADGKEDWNAEVRDATREVAEQAADAARQAADAIHEGFATIHAEFSGSICPLPPMTGGKVVAGTLNGGGVEIQAASLNGDIILRKSD